VQQSGHTQFVTSEFHLADVMAAGSIMFVRHAGSIKLVGISAE
tara:strand:- start:997 stop:1125 length:129 start_codon:yes stop_codon:yes gene_type:complete